MNASDRPAAREAAANSKIRELVLLGSAMLLCAAGAATLYLLRDEDAFIYYRYALNWARGLGLVFNAGEPVEGATKWAGQSERDDWRLFEDYNRRNVTAAYSEFEWDQ